MTRGVPRDTERETFILAAVRAGSAGAEIGRQLGITRERVRQIWTRATAEPLPMRGSFCRWCAVLLPAVHSAADAKAHRHSEEHRTAIDARRADRFWARVDKSNPHGCWPYTGSINPQTGYGSSHMFGEHNAHRVAYRLSRGHPVPRGLTVDHLCRNHACVNPAHLEAVTHRENIMRSPIAIAAVNARKTHCKRGHPFDAVRSGGRGRRCRACARERLRMAA